MKSCLLLLFSYLLSALAHAQHLPAAQVPAAVRQAFTRAQPQATQVQWHRQGATYEAAFRQQAQRGVLQLAATGTVLETRLDVAYSAFPPLARTAMSEQFPHRQLDRITRVTNAAGETSYVVLVCRGKDKKGKDKDCQSSVFDESGRPLPK